MASPVTYTVSDDGKLSGIAAGSVAYPFRTDAVHSFGIQVSTDPWNKVRVGQDPTPVVLAKTADKHYSGTCGDFGFAVTFGATADGLGVTVDVAVKNNAAAAKQLQLLRLVTGLDFLNDGGYPAYLNKFMPTSLDTRGDAAGRMNAGSQMHFLTPNGKAIWMGTADAVDAWYLQHDGYSQIYTAAWDILNTGCPRAAGWAPANNPGFGGGETRTFRFVIAPLQIDVLNPSMTAFEGALSDAVGTCMVKYVQRPFIKHDAVTAGTTPSRTLVVYHDAAQALKGLDGHPTLQFANPTARAVTGGVAATTYTVTPVPNTVGTVSDFRVHYDTADANPPCAAGKIAFARSWDFYIGNQAAYYMDSEVHPYVGNSCENWMHVFAWQAMQIHGGWTQARQDALEAFMGTQFISKQLFDPDTGDLLNNGGRIQNRSNALDCLRCTYLAAKAAPAGAKLSKDPMYWLDFGVKVADQLLKFQRADGGFYGTGGYGKYYVCVYYIAKSFFDFIDALKAAGVHADKVAVYEPALDKCLADLKARGTQIATEGMDIFEDGAIACAALQLAQYANRAKDASYTAVAQAVQASHRCLEFRHSSVCHDGASLRFWEAAYYGYSPCLNTPHGWSAWQGNAHHELYLATGDTQHLFKMLNCIQTGYFGLFNEPGLAYWINTPTPTVSNFDHVVAAGGASRAPVGAAGESAEFPKLLMDAVLNTAHVFRHNGEWCGVGCDIDAAGKVTLVRGMRPQKMYVNGGGGANAADLDLACIPQSVTVMDMTGEPVVGARKPHAVPIAVGKPCPLDADAPAAAPAPSAHAVTALLLGRVGVALMAAVLVALWLVHGRTAGF